MNSDDVDLLFLGGLVPAILLFVVVKLSAMLRERQRLIEALVTQVRGWRSEAKMHGATAKELREQLKLISKKIKDIECPPSNLLHPAPKPCSPKPANPSPWEKEQEKLAEQVNRLIDGPNWN